MHIAYGYQVKETEDPFLTAVELAVLQFSLSTAPGGFLVNLIPSLRYLPAWFPGAGFKKTAALWAESLVNMVEQPYQYVKQQMAAGTAEPSFTSHLLEDSPTITSTEREHEIKWSAASLYSGGADTTVAAIHAFFLAMILNPDVMRKAQAEIDAVVGQDRLPSFADRQSLPYINALVLEVVRWHSVTPTGFPHRVMEDNIHDGYTIPKGAVIIPNIWFMTHDPQVYPDPFKQMAAGTAEPSFTAHLLEDSPTLTTEQEHEIKWSAASLYSGGADTTVASIHAFFLAMILNPDVVRKAQAEIDAVVGQDRLPGFADRQRLPYINAIVLEVMRWHSVTPTGAPHRVMEDNIHEDYMIPKGALIIANVWFMAHDPQVYPDPFKFNPERFLGPEPQQDPRDIFFGFGRRICPGRVLADSSLFISCAMALAVFDITKYSKDGIVVEPVVEQTTGTISHPKPFKCIIKPRSPKALDLIKADEL
jgi:cytochrome P450